jgi:hypothetical protein
MQAHMQAHVQAISQCLVASQIGSLHLLLVGHLVDHPVRCKSIPAS